MKHWSAVGGALLLLLALVGGLWLTAPQPVTGQASVPCYREQGGAKWVGGSGCEWEMQSGATLDIQSGVTASISDLTVSDDLIVTDDASVGGDLTASGDVRLAAQTAISVTNGATVTPTGVYQRIEAAGNVGTASIAAGTAGDLLILVNTANVTITFTDTGTLKLSGNAALGQYDTLMLLADGTNWIQVAPEGDN